MTSQRWQIEKLVPGGAGMARLDDGRIGFAHGALPGERIQIDQQQSKKDYVTATSFRVLVPAAERIEPPCPVATLCGGCDWLHVRYDAQLRYKVDLIREALERVGKFRDLPTIGMHASPREVGYRSRVRVHIDVRGRVGFHVRATRDLVEIASCAVARPELNRALAQFRALSAEQPRAAGEFTEAELRVSSLDPLPSARLVPRDRLRAQNPFVAALGTCFSVEVGEQRVRIDQRWPLLDGRFLWVPAGAFVQVNWEVNLLLVSALVEGAALRKARTFLDVYAGVGNFSVALLARGLSGTAIESVLSAAQAAQRSLAEQGLSEGRVLIGDAARVLAQRAFSAVDLVVLDPPRRGAQALLGSLRRLAAPFIAYCSCDPVTLARDLAKLARFGYVIDCIDAFDMFPGTHHVETLVFLRRE